MGGIPGYNAPETTDEDSSRVALLQRATTAYLKSALGIDEDAWRRWQAGLIEDPEPRAAVSSK